MADPMTEEAVEKLVLAAAEQAKVRASTLAPSARKRGLDAELKKQKAAGNFHASWSISEPKGWEEPLEVTVFVVVPGVADAQIVVVLVPVEPISRAVGKAGRQVAERRQNDDDAVIRGVADLLEAKVRTERVAETWRRGPASDPGIVYDTMELALRTVREAMTLSSRAQRVLLEHLDRAAPQPRDRVAALQLPEGVVRISGKNGRFEGGFRLTNRTSRWMRPEFEAEVVLLDGQHAEVICKVETGDVDIAPGATQRVWITLATPSTPPPNLPLSGVLKEKSPARFLADIPIVVQ